MKAALKISTKGTGFTEPNPMVGAVAVKNNKIIAAGCHCKYGEAHAEQVVLKNVTEKDTTLYVTLEPCIHHGKTPPCTDLILEKKVKRVVAAVKDPNPLVNGKGIKKLGERGVRVDVGLLEDMALKINRHYFKYMTGKRPYVTLKAGVSLDGKLTDKYRKSQWITGGELRNFAHSLRGEFSSILAGVKTILDDDPQLTVRQKAWGNKKLYRVVLDSQNTLDTGLRIFENRENFPLIIFSSLEAKNKTPKSENHFFVNPNKGPHGLNLQEVLETLHRLEIASVLVEGGGSIIDSFLKEELYDEIFLEMADKLIGGQESVQLFSSGTGLSCPVKLTKREIIPLQTGFIVRGYRE